MAEHETRNTGNEASDRLQQQHSHWEQFISTFAHELKAPLAVLVGDAQTLRRQEPRQDGVSGFVETVERESRKLLRSIEAFGALAGARARECLPATTDVSLEDTALTSVQACRPLADERGIRILPNFDATDGIEEPHVAGDPDLLRVMVENLIENAIGRSHPNDTVQVSVTSSPTHATITVRDGGPHIPTEQLSQVFDAFDPFATRSRRGPISALPLAVVKAVAGLHGGKATAANTSDAGCEFTVGLPTSTASQSRPPG